MPTIKPRYQITETADIGHALDVAAQRWPHESRSRLLVRLVRAGGAALEQSDNDEIRRRRAAADQASGKYGGVFSRGYLAQLRRDWPE